MTEYRLSGTTPPGGPPSFDPSLVGAAARRVEIQSVELVQLHFMDEESERPFVDHDSVQTGEPSFGLSVDWGLSEDDEFLGCLVKTWVDFAPAEEGGLWISATYRATYSVAPEGDALTEDQIQQFAHWNVVFNVWPFWRELAASVLQRSRHTPYLVPVFKMPRA